VSEFTHVLARVEQGDPKAAQELLPLVHEELRELGCMKSSGQIQVKSIILIFT